MAVRDRRDGFTSAGALLAKAREQEQRSVKEIAQELHLDEWIISALEADDYGRIGAPVFVKGHLRKYADLMEVPIDDVIAAYYRSENAPSTPPLVAARAESGKKLPKISSAMVVSMVTVAVIVLITAWWFRRDEPTVPEMGDTDKIEPAAIASSAATGTQDDTQVESPVTEGMPLQVVPAPVQSPSDAAVQRQTTPPPANDSPSLPGGQLRFSMAFEQESWVEIRDARGRRLYFGMAESGASPSVDGVPPLDVLLGNASSVELQVNGEAFVIPRGSRRGRTARFQVE